MKLPKKATILDALTLASALRQAGSVNGLHLDASAVEHIDTSILQLLCALRKTASASVIQDPSAAFVATAQRCGIAHLLFEKQQGVV